MTHRIYIWILALSVLAGCASSSDDVAEGMNRKKTNLQKSIEVIARAERCYRLMADTALKDQQKKSWADSARMCRKQIALWQEDIADIDWYLSARNHP